MSVCGFFIPSETDPFLQQADKEDQFALLVQATNVNLDNLFFKHKKLNILMHISELKVYHRFHLLVSIFLTKG